MSAGAATAAARVAAPPSSVGHWTAFAAVLVLLVVAPLALPEFWRRFVTEILIWGLLAMSSDILIGYTGMVSFGHSAFFGLGIYGAATALLTVRPPNLWLATLYGLVAAVVSMPAWSRSTADASSPSACDMSTTTAAVTPRW